MFFRSLRSLILAAILLIVGCVQLSNGWDYADSAKRELSTVGKLTYVTKGKSSTYEYSFEINGFKTGSISGTCKTALTLQGCEVGASVLVYYDPTHRSSPMLQEFGAASREKLFMGAWMAGCGLLLIGVYFVLKRTGEDEKKPDEPNDSELNREPDVLHIVPGQ
jgi:hypothetical protein